MKNDLPDHLKIELNSSVIQFLEGKSSHGDLSEFFHQTLNKLDKANTFTPTDRPYSYYLTYANATIFGFCESMQYVTYRLPEFLHANAISDGGVPHKHLTRDGWINFPAWGAVKPDHAQWAKHAYMNALN